ncbi:MAG: hypothetical protein QNJ44_10630 [Rhodobacter sp.]|nr:hypothetical protein [Rhodobacter sp.]
MTRSAFLIGGSGQIGLAVAERLFADGWEVRIGSRHAPPAGPWRHAPLDRNAPGALAGAVGEGTDLLLDCVAFDADHAGQLLDLQDVAGRIVAVSSASVYVDAHGRTLDEAREHGFPDLPVPVAESHPTVAPGNATYSTRKAAMEARLREACGRATILRPCAIHGPHSKHAREWWFVKRLLDSRARIPLAYGGKSRFQTTSARAIADAVVWACSGDAPPVINVCDADAPDVAQIGQTIMNLTGMRADLVPMPDEPFPPRVGMTPWSTARPFVCASSVPAARRYAETVGPALDWLIGLRDRDWRAALPQLAAYDRNHFDYAAEDTALP